MFGFLKRWFADQETRAGFDDPQFGPMPVEAETGRWIVDLPVAAARRLRISIAGDQAPAPALLAHARDVAADVPAFVARIEDFLAASAQESALAGLAAQIRALEVEELDLMWPGRPDDGMVFFHNAQDDDRLWRCDYVGRQPRSLGFDS